MELFLFRGQKIFCEKFQNLQMATCARQMLTSPQSVQQWIASAYIQWIMVVAVHACIVTRMIVSERMNPHEKVLDLPLDGEWQLWGRRQPLLSNRVIQPQSVYCSTMQQDQKRSWNEVQIQQLLTAIIPGISNFRSSLRRSSNMARATRKIASIPCIHESSTKEKKQHGTK